MPNLENLKKQAKLLLRWHRERYHPVAAQIRRLMPRFANVPDSEILVANFKLSDAQEMIARQHGFGSWSALKAGLSATPPKLESPPSKAKIVDAEPQLLVADIKRSCQFFRGKLGFSLVFSYGDPPYYAQVGRQKFRGQGSGWKSAAVCWPRKLAVGRSAADPFTGPGENHRRHGQQQGTSCGES